MAFVFTVPPFQNCKVYKGTNGIRNVWTKASKESVLTMTLAEVWCIVTLRSRMKDSLKEEDFKKKIPFKFLGWYCNKSHDSTVVSKEKKKDLPACRKRL